MLVTPLSPYPDTDHGSAAGAAGATVEPGGAAVLTAALSVPRPLIGAALLAGWVACGVLIALVVARRGHDARPLVAVGVLLGPLLAGYVAVTVSDHERDVEPLETDHGARGPGSVDVLVAVLGDPAQVRDALPHLRSLGSNIGEVVLARPVTFEAADERDALATEARTKAAAELAEAASVLPDIEPRLVLLPGRLPRSISDFAAANGISQVVAVGDRLDRMTHRLDGALPDGTSLIVPSRRAASQDDA